MTPPALGIGTASIGGRVSRRRGAQALRHAYAAGIRHFDTARSYGWGDAERVVGGVLGQVPRESFRLVTKCGILPIRRSPLLSAAKSAARLALALAPALRARVRRVAADQKFQPIHTYDTESLDGSLRTSLAELGMSYVDVLLLHNFSPDAPGIEPVVDLFRELRRTGVIRRFGFSIEGDLTRGLAFLAARDLLDDGVVQVPVSQSLFSLPREWRSVPVIAHSPFGFLRQEVEREGSAATLTDLLQRLEEACRCETLVCSMFTPAHLQANVAAWKLA